MTDARLAELLAYCRLDEPDGNDRAMLESMLSSAEVYLLQAGVDKPAEDDVRRPLYNSLANALVLDDWDNRGSQTAGYTISENPAFRRKLNQMKLTEPVHENAE